MQRLPADRSPVASPASQPVHDRTGTGGPTGDDNLPATVRLSYQELADRLGISYDSARARARRQWHIAHGNDGRPVVTVPLADLPPVRSPETSPEQSPVSPPETAEKSPDASPVTSPVIQAIERAAAAEARLALVEEQLERVRAELGDLRGADTRAAVAEALVVELRGQLAREQERGLVAAVRRLLGISQK